MIGPYIELPDGAFAYTDLMSHSTPPDLVVAGRPVDHGSDHVVYMHPDSPDGYPAIHHRLASPVGSVVWRKTTWYLPTFFMICFKPDGFAARLPHPGLLVHATGRMSFVKTLVTRLLRGEQPFYETHDSARSALMPVQHPKMRDGLYIHTEFTRDFLSHCSPIDHDNISSFFLDD